MKWLLLAALPLWSAITSITWPDSVTVLRSSLSGTVNNDVAVNASGNGIVVWSQSTGIFSAYYPTGTEWGSVATVVAAPSQTNPQISMDPNSNAITVWREGGEGFILSAYRPAGDETSWAGAQGLGVRFLPQVDMDSEGNAVAVWDAGTTIQSAYRPTGDGSSWNGSVTISATGDMSNPQVSVDPEGNAVAVWDAGTTIQSAYRPAGDVDDWSAPVTISGTGTMSNPQVSVDAEGNAVAVWSTGTLIQAAYRPAGDASTWNSPVTISGTGTMSNPQVSADPSGNAVAVWDAGTVIQSAYRPAGNTDNWGSVVAISSADEAVESPQVATDTEGNAVSVWYTNPGGGINVLQSSYRNVSTGAWSTPVDLTPSDESWTLPSLALVPDGNVFISAQGSSNTRVGVLIGAVTRAPPTTTRTVFWGSRKIEVQVSQ